MLKIAHITDTHISLEGEKLNGIDTREKFLQVLSQIKSKDYDLLVHTGDLAFPEGNREVYEWIKGQLDSLNLPYYMTPGNHDDILLMQEIFNLKDLPPRVILNGAVAAKGESLMFLDSSSERLTVKQALWLVRELEVQQDELFLFMHHPPCSCGVKLMDTKYPYKTPDYFQRTLAGTGRDLTLFTGHYHIGKKVPQDRMTVYISPPSFGSLDPEAEDYVMADPRGGWREICIDKQKIISTDCKYLD